MTLTNRALRLVTFNNRRKSQPKSILYWKGCLSFKFSCFQQLLSSYRNKLKNCTKFVKRPFGLLFIVPWRLSCTILRGKIGHSILSPEGLPFSSETFVFKKLLGVKEMILKFPQFSEYLPELYKLLLEVCLNRYVEKKWPKRFFHWKGCRFFQKTDFSQPLRCYRNDLLTSRVIVRRLFGPSKNHLLSFFKFDNTRKGPKSCFLCEMLPVFHKLLLHHPLRSYRNKLITCTKNVKRLLGPSKLFCDFCHVRYYEKIWATGFFSLERLPFAQKFVFSTAR